MADHNRFCPPHHPPRCRGRHHPRPHHPRGFHCPHPPRFHHPHHHRPRFHHPHHPRFHEVFHIQPPGADPICSPPCSLLDPPGSQILPPVTDIPQPEPVQPPPRNQPPSGPKQLPDKQPVVIEVPAERREGFECEFVENPPESFPQSDCPVCLCVLCEPYQVTCCGYSFCHGCIDRIKRDKKACPTCNERNFNDFPNKGLQRSLYMFRVYCTKKVGGCDWIGELGQLDNHLQQAH